jgi:YfiH family protein
MSTVASMRDGDAIELALTGGGRALFTTRAGGNLSLSAGPSHEQGLAERERLCAALGLHWLCASPQVHGTDVRRVTAQTHSGGQPVAEPADGHATALSGIGVMVLAADCAPVLLGAPGAVAAVHAGWRGLAAGVLERGVQALRELAPEGEASAVIGPCAGSCCYEVGEEVLSALGLPRPSPGSTKAMLGLRAVARKRLIAAGVESVIDIDRCTICDERMFSHRRQGSAAGRQAAIAWLP